LLSNQRNAESLKKHNKRGKGEEKRVSGMSQNETGEGQQHVERKSMKARKKRIIGLRKTCRYIVQRNSWGSQNGGQKQYKRDVTCRCSRPLRVGYRGFEKKNRWGNSRSVKNAAKSSQRNFRLMTKRRTEGKGRTFGGGSAKVTW